MDYEPSLAIFTASDGLALTSALVGQIAARSEVQMVALEIAIGQGDAVTKLLSDAGFASVERRTDLTGNERTVIATKNGR
jgi:methylase of polypeptide subunit release factors